MINEYITNAEIKKAEKLGACQNIIDWLREKPRKWSDLAPIDRLWVIKNAYQYLKPNFCAELIDKR